MENFDKFNAVDYLDNEETIVEYLTAALEDGNADVFLAAIAPSLNLQKLLAQITEENMHQEADTGFTVGEEIL
jgi:DNA-binding phage protein